MYDHVLMFKDKTEALNLLNLKEEFDSSNTIEDLQITIDDKPIPGYYVCVSLNEPSQDLIKLPNAACRIVTDREAASEGENFFVYVAPDLDTNLLSVAKISPSFMGSEYPYGT